MLPTSLWNASLAIPPPFEMTTGPVATTETLPPWLASKAPLWIVPPPVRVSEPKLVEMLPGNPSPGASGSKKKLRRA